MNNSILNLVEIVQNASLLTSTTEQIQNIVDSVCKAIQVDVCSLYRMDSDEQMVLLASHGLTVNHPIKIPAGRGLVGLVASTRHPLNIDDAATHPDYYYVALSKEENFHSFCGVPLVRRGEVIGILVAQREKAEKLDSESEAAIQQALRKLVVGKTVLIIAHRFSTIRDASVILVFDQGRVADQGTHSDLMARNDLYRSLYDRQTAQLAE